MPYVPEIIYASRYADMERTEAARAMAESIVSATKRAIENTEWLKGTLALSRHGEIEVDARGQTSVPGVFAAGDVTTVPYKQIVIAVGEGAKAASLASQLPKARQELDATSPDAAGLEQAASELRGAASRLDATARPRDAAPPEVSSSHTVTINPGSQSTRGNVASRTDADALTSVLRQLQTSASVANPYA